MYISVDSQSYHSSICVCVFVCVLSDVLFVLSSLFKDGGSAYLHSHMHSHTHTHAHACKHAHTLPYNHACICSHTFCVILKSYFHRQRRKRKWGKPRLHGGGAGVTSNQDGASTASKEEGAFPYSGEEERRGESSDFEDSRCRAVRKSKRPLNTLKNTPGQFVDA